MIANICRIGLVNVGNILSWNIFDDIILVKGITKGRWTSMRNTAAYNVKELVKLENEFNKKLRKLEKIKTRENK